MPTRQDFQKLAVDKIEEAKVLFKGGFYHGAFYLAGYALEFSTKAAVCKNLKIDNFFDKKASNDPTKLNDGILDKFRTHDYKMLLLLAGLYHQLEEDKKSNRDFAINWSHIENMAWNETCRYENSSKFNKIDIEQYLNALENKQNGFIQWIQQYW